jgi:flagellar basal body-associated protein FliL
LRRPAVLLLAALLLLLADPALAAEPEHGGHGQPSEGPPAPQGPVFVRMPPIVVPVIEGDKVTRQVGVNIVLELAEGHGEADVAPKRQLLQDAFIRDLYGIYQARAGTGRAVSEQVVKARFGRSAAAILGPGVVQDVLIQQLFEQPRAR